MLFIIVINARRYASAVFAVIVRPSVRIRVPSHIFGISEARHL